MGTAGTLGQLGATAFWRAASVLAGFAVAATVTGAAWGVQDIALSTTGPLGGDPIVIEGSITGVVAGAPSAPLRLTLRNPADQPRTVRRVRADSTGVENGPAGCTAGFLEVGDWTGGVTVPAHGSASVTLPVRISPELPAECVDVAWRLAYTAF